MSKTPSRWIPLEANPEVLSAWATQAGLVASSATFQDVYGLDPELLAMIPKPVKAVILLFPITVDTEMQRKEEDAKIKERGQPEVDPSIIFIRQTISNACGTIGLLHTLANCDLTVQPQSPLAKFIDQAKSKTPEERAELLENTELFASIHASAANGGQSSVPSNLDTEFHFTTFVRAPSPIDNKLRLVELDGRRDGPVDRGPSDDFLAAVSRVVKEKYIGEATTLKFSMIALAPPDV